MTKFVLLSVIVFSGFIILQSCSGSSKSLNLRQSNRVYTESIPLEEVVLLDTALLSIISDYLMELKMFESHVNSTSPIKVEYYVLVDSYCNNDSTFFKISASVGSYLFYRDTDSLNPLIMDFFRIAEVQNTKIVLYSDLKSAICKGNSFKILEEKHRKGLLKFQWYKDQSGSRILFLYPYFYNIYHFENGRYNFVRSEEMEAVIK